MSGKRNKRPTTLYMPKKEKRSPFQRSIFIHTSQEQDRAMNRLNFLIRLVITLLLLGLVVVFVIFVFSYLLPFLQKELAGTGSNATQSSTVSFYNEPVLTYDDLGLPIYENDITLAVINAKNPATLEDVPDIDEVEGIKVNEHMKPALEALLEASSDAGHPLILDMGYVSYGDQQDLYEAKVKQLMEENGASNVMARTEAERTTPVAGESDFQTGMCVRISGNPETFPESKTFLWLDHNMADYGFIFRYPDGKIAEIGMDGNYCVLRYVGVANAKRMRQLSMSMEEYVTYLSAQED